MVWEGLFFWGPNGIAVCSLVEANGTGVWKWDGFKNKCDSGQESRRMVLALVMAYRRPTHYTILCIYRRGNFVEGYEIKP